MAKRVTSPLLLCIAVGVMAACSDSKDKAVAVDPNVVPARYRQEVVDTLRDEVFSKNDTTSVSDALISEPVLRPVGSDQRYTICVRYTAHGTAANLTATAERIGYFYGGHLTQLVETSGNECRNAAYKPFPELNQVCLGKACK
jgi:hypothetical protein